jgi:hypothetical protein
MTDLNVSLIEGAHLYAGLFITQHDAAIGCFKAKYTYNLIRMPVAGGANYTLDNEGMNWMLTLEWHTPGYILLKHCKTTTSLALEELSETDSFNSITFYSAVSG